MRPRPGVAALRENPDCADDGLCGHLGIDPAIFAGQSRRDDARREDIGDLERYLVSAAFNSPAGEPARNCVTDTAWSTGRDEPIVQGHLGISQWRPR
jgi:hypothetical protein